MKKSNLAVLTLLFGILLFLFACRKDIEYYIKDRVETPSSQLEMAKVWRLRHLDRNADNSRGF